MQLALIDSGRPVAPRTTPERVATTARSEPAPPVTPVEAVRAPDSPLQSTRQAASLRGGLTGVDTQLNQRVATAQRTVEFLDRAAGQLQGLRSALTSQLTPAGEPSTADLARQMRRFEALWRERPAATGGTLDGRLAQVAPGDARQTFTVRGLSLAALRTADAETLYLAVGGRTQHAAAVTIEPGLSDEAIVQRFDRALAPNGIRAARDANGELGFSVPETAWSTTRDALAIKGEGRRFPTGQFATARIVAEEPVIRPDRWSADNPPARRDTLQKVVDALEAIRNAQRSAAQALMTGMESLQPPSQADATWSTEFVRTFEATAARGDYQSLSALSPALLGIHRERVVALLRAAAG
ncbi:MAG TPA: hypothetical protein PKE27_01015 [Povalibacter sp.]|uniref:hypothetical protein n=1 Tax=Povalibacter sp. TaxID=1962978 RepID=UPI002BCBA261|nr:hypothetical protein [Povalibacter sp.]HMN43128.1 hypothetical protein [Povalibacter sp.]